MMATTTSSSISVKPAGRGPSAGAVAGRAHAAYFRRRSAKNTRADRPSIPVEASGTTEAVKVKLPTLASVSPEVFKRPTANSEETPRSPEMESVEAVW